jgi:rhodanese-related sulfurtransferase/biotin operon repressor
MSKDKAMDHDFNHRLYSCFARVGKAVSNGHRVSLLHHLGQGERSVEVLAGLAGLSIANTSQHLQHLRNAGLVVSRKVGQHVFYSLSDDIKILKLLELVQSLAVEQLPEINQLIKDSPAHSEELEPINADELLGNPGESDTVFIDLRQPEEYDAGHLPGAINIPYEELHERISEVAAMQDVVIYSRGPYCELGPKAARKLRDNGVSARHMRQGIPHWRLAGLPVKSRRRFQAA